MGWYELGFEKHIKNFKTTEFSESPIHAKKSLIYAMDNTRDQIQNRIFPSPVPGALARFSKDDKDSQHFAGDANPSCALDWFSEGVPMRNFLAILGSGMFTAIGIYFDVNGPDGLPWIMFHTDQRKWHLRFPLIWFYKEFDGKGVYVYPFQETRYMSWFQDERLYQGKFKDRSA